MSFRDMFLMDRPSGFVPPMRIYFHTSGRREFGKDSGQQTKGAMDYIRTAFRQSGEDGELYYHRGWEFAVGALWGNDGQQILDVFGATEGEIASKNPKIDGWVVRNGVARREGKTLLDIVTLVSAEFDLRVKSNSLLGYLHAPMAKLPFVSGGICYISV